MHTYISLADFQSQVSDCSLLNNHLETLPLCLDVFFE